MTNNSQNVINKEQRTDNDCCPFLFVDRAGATALHLYAMRPPLF